MASRGRGATVKGRDFERRVAKALTPLLGVGELRRVYISESTDHKQFPGDICRVDGGSMPLVVECKAQPFDLADCMNVNANVKGWMQQADDHATAAGVRRFVVAVSWHGCVALVHDRQLPLDWIDPERTAEFLCDGYAVEILG